MDQDNKTPETKPNVDVKALEISKQQKETAINTQQIIQKDEEDNH